MNYRFLKISVLICLMFFIQTFYELAAQTGTGTHFTPSYVNVTGGGAMPDTLDGLICNCDGTGATDVTDCLQAALDSSAQIGKPLLIPYTDGFYKISGKLMVNGSLMGIGGMPAIRQTDEASQALLLMDDMSGWIYNLHIIGTYDGVPRPESGLEYAHNIALRGVNGITISHCLLETPQGDNIGDDGGASNMVRNVLITNNTMVNPWRCNISGSGLVDRQAIMNNALYWYSQYVDPIDFEPYQELSRVTNIEVGYNYIYSPNPTWSDEHHFYEAVLMITAYFDHTPGGNIFAHHNYGDWQAPFSKTVGFQGAPSNWTHVLILNNAKGDTIPGSDTLIPDKPDGLNGTEINATSFLLSWHDASDDVAVAGYLVIRGDTILGTTVNTSFPVTGLSCGSVYAMTVKAYDAAGNVSESSQTLKIATLNCGGGSANMLVNPGFEEPLSVGWTEDWGASALDSTEVRSGNYALRTGPVAGGRAQPLVDFVPGDTYTVSAWCKVTGNGLEYQKAYIGADIKDADGIRIYTPVSEDITDSLEWKQYSVTFTVPLDAASVAIFVYQEAPDNNTTSVLTDDWAVVSLVQVTGVTITPEAATIRLGIVKQLAAAVEPANATNQEIRWSSSDTTIATVSPVGLVKGMKQGTATITVTTLDGDKTATCDVTVAPPGNNMLKNPGIEKALSTGWTDDWGNNAVWTSQYHSGTKCLAVGPSDGGRAQPITDFIPGSTYTLSAWCMLSGSDHAAQAAYIGADFRDAGGARIFTPSALITDSVNWQQVSVTFTIPDEARAMVVFAYLEAGDVSTNYILTDDWGLISGWTPLPFEIPTSISGRKTSTHVGLYPNPLTGQALSIEGAERDDVLSLFDMTGRMIYSLKLGGSEIQVIDLENSVQKGSYVVKITGRTGSSSQLLLVE